MFWILNVIDVLAFRVVFRSITIDLSISRPSKFVIFHGTGIFVARDVVPSQRLFSKVSRALSGTARSTTLRVPPSLPFAVKLQRLQMIYRWDARIACVVRFVLLNVRQVVNSRQCRPPSRLPRETSWNAGETCTNRRKFMWSKSRVRVDLYARL